MIAIGPIIKITAKYNKNTLDKKKELTIIVVGDYYRDIILAFA